MMTGAKMKPTQLLPPGMKFKKPGSGNKIVGSQTNGQVWEWMAGSRTPIRMNIPRPATDIFVSHLDMAGIRIIPASREKGQVWVTLRLGWQE